MLRTEQVRIPLSNEEHQPLPLFLWEQETAFLPVMQKDKGTFDFGWSKELCMRRRRDGGKVKVTSFSFIFPGLFRLTLATEL